MNQVIKIRQVPITISNIKISGHDKNIINIGLSILEILWGQLLFIQINIDYKINTAIIKEKKQLMSL